MPSGKCTATNGVLWIFAVGQLGWAILSGIVTNLLVFFYHPGETALFEGQEIFITQRTFIIFTVIGIISSFGRIFDAFTDPLIAGISDRFRGRLGRRIPFMRYSALPFGLVTVLMFISPVNGSSPLNVAALSVCVILFYFCLTCYCIPYNALIPELGRTQEMRINLSTYISLTYFMGTALAYVVPAISEMFRDSLGYAGSYRAAIAILTVIAVVCMLVPAFLIDENKYADTSPSESPALRSLASTFRNREFRTFVASDVLYWIALTLFQTGLLYYVTELLGLSASSSTVLFMVMSILSLCFYPAVNVLSKRVGKKKLIAFAFADFSLAFLVTGYAGKTPLPGMAYGILIAVMAALPMAILGILPQAVVADIAEQDKLVSGESRHGMFYAARTFSFKLGQSVGLLIFTSVAGIGRNSGMGYRLTAVIAAVLCLLGGIVFLRYNETKVMSQITASDNDDK